MQRILVVDDDEDLREFFQLTLKAKGYEVHAVPNAKKAQEYLGSNTPDLILMDVMMPDMNGVELCRWVRKQAATKETPIIQVSGLKDDVTMQDSMEMGSVDYVVKPVKTSELLQKISLALSRAKNNGGAH